MSLVPSYSHFKNLFATWISSLANWTWTMRGWVIRSNLSFEIGFMIKILDYGAVHVYHVVSMTCMILRIHAPIVMPFLDDTEVEIAESKIKP